MSNMAHLRRKSSNDEYREKAHLTLPVSFGLMGMACQVSAKCATNAPEVILTAANTQVILGTSRPERESCSNIATLGTRLYLSSRCAMVLPMS